MALAEISIRPMELEDIRLAVEWAAHEGWNPGLHDAECFYAADRNGFFMAERDGRPAGCISAVAYDESFGFAGFFIVPEELRHHGIGMKLTNAAAEYMDGRTIGGDGVVEMLPKYERIGFRIAHHNARYEGVGTGTPQRLPELKDIPFTELERYDRRYFPAPRSEFLKAWISRPGTYGRAVVVQDRLAGYGVMRLCRKGFKIGPIFADTPAVGEALFSSLAPLAQGEPVFLDIPTSNPAAYAMVERHSMRRVFETARIYKGPAPRLPLEGIYGITSFELG